MSEKKSSWSSQTGYIWSLLGSAIGFANLLAFGSECFRYGGAAYLIPFLIALFTLGIPMLVLEALIGQTYNKPLVSAYGYLKSRFKPIGWISIFTVSTIGTFYTVLTGWSLAYTYFSIRRSIPSNTTSFFYDTFLQQTNSLSDFGSLSTSIFFATLAVCILTWFIVRKDIQAGIEKWCSMFLPILLVFIVIFTIVSAIQPGASIGLLKYLKPDFSKIKELEIWHSVFGQLFFSLSLGIGIVVGYSRHTIKNVSLTRSLTLVGLSDFFISFLAGFIIFCCIGYMSHQQHVAFDSILTTDTNQWELGYIIFPTILKLYGPFVEQVFGAVFFFSIFIAGITGVFSILESMIGNMIFEFNMPRTRAATLSMMIIFIGCIPFCFGNALFIIDSIWDMAKTTMLLSAIVQLFVFFSKKLAIEKISNMV